jgi:hypothetical protein
MRSSGNPGIRSVQKFPAMPSPAKILCWRLLPVLIKLRRTQRVGFMFVRRSRRVLILFEQNHIPQLGWRRECRLNVSPFWLGQF